MNRRTLFLIGLLFQVAAIFGLYLPYSITVATGEIVRLKTMPVDPRSLFRGDYVTLDYEVAQIEGTGEYVYGDTIYLILEPREDAYERVGISKTQPELTGDQVCLLGRYQGWIIIIPGLAQYFVEEDTGRELEQARNAHRLYVDAAVTEDCDAVIRNVILGPEVPPEENPFDPPQIPDRPVAEPTR